MKKSDFKYQASFAIREITIPSGEEWRPGLSGWSLIHIRQGTGYCLQSQMKQELATGAVLLAFGFFEGSVRASQLGELSLNTFNVFPGRLTGLITLSEQHQLKLPPPEASLLKILPPESPTAVKIHGLFADKYRRGLLFRLKLLQIFAEYYVEEPGTAESTELHADTSDAMKRLQAFLQDLPASELLEMDFNELAEKTHCTSRHLSRIFCKLVGMSFTDKRAELRLKKAQDILATTDSKVVQVALESGYNSLSQFNLMFARRYGISPGKWRRQNRFAKFKSNGIKGGQRTSPAESQPVALSGNLSLKPVGSRNGNGNLRFKQF